MRYVQCGTVDDLPYPFRSTSSHQSLDTSAIVIQYVNLIQYVTLITYSCIASGYGQAARWGRATLISHMYWLIALPGAACLRAEA